MIIDKPGIYDIPEDVYHADPCVEPSLSSSGAKTILTKTPLHYHYERENPKKRTAAMSFGAAAHMSLLEPEKYASRYYEMPEGLTMAFAASKDLKDAHSEQEIEEIKQEARNAEASGKVLLSKKDSDIIKGMAEGMGRKKEVLSKFIVAPKEQSAFWKDATFKVWRRARFDYMPRNGRLFADYKTTESLDEEAIKRSVSNYGWFQQAAWYMDAITALKLNARPVFLFIIQEKSPPYEVVIRYLDQQALAYGRMMNARAMDLFARGVETGEWPGYSDEPAVTGLPRYAENKLEECREAEEFKLSYRMQAPFYNPDNEEIAA